MTARLNESNEPLQITEKTNEFRRFAKSFRPPFSKGGAVEVAETSSRSAEREILFRRFSFWKLFLLRLHRQKKKRLKSLHIATNCIFEFRQYRTILMVQLHRQKFRQTNQIEAGNSGSIANEICAVWWNLCKQMCRHGFVRYCLKS